MNAKMDTNWLTMSVWPSATRNNAAQTRVGLMQNVSKSVLDMNVIANTGTFYYRRSALNSAMKTNVSLTMSVRQIQPVRTIALGSLVSAMTDSH